MRRTPDKDVDRRVVTACPNCGAERSGPFCAACGQNDRDYVRSLSLMVGEFVKETFELDSRFLRTLRTMILRPGELSAEFSRNRRASYSSPVRFYLFVSLAFFFVLSMTADLGPPTEQWPEAEVELDRASEGADVERLKSLLSEEDGRKVDAILAYPGRPFVKILVYEAAKAVSGTGAEVELDRFGRFLAGQLLDVLHQPLVAADRLVDNLPVAMFVTLPAYAGLLALFYLRKRRYYVEHLVFAVHVHTVAFAVFTVRMLVPGGDFLSLVLLVYYFLALKRYYGDGIVRTGLKWLLSLLAYGILLVPGLLLAMFVTLYSL